MILSKLRCKTFQNFNNFWSYFMKLFDSENVRKCKSKQNEIIVTLSIFFSEILKCSKIQ